MATTVADSSEIQKEVRDVFNEVNTFFAAMTKALASTPMPGEAGQWYSIFNYNALRTIIDTSGSFIQIQMEKIYHELTEFSATFSEDLLLGVIGLAVEKEAISTFAKSMVSSMGQAGLTVSSGVEKDDSKVSNIIFVLEYLLGMPIVTAMVIHVDKSEVAQYAKIGPCFNEKFDKATMTINKDSYLFVPPKYVKEFSSEILSGEDNPAFLKLVAKLKSALGSNPLTVSDVFDTNKGQIVSALTAGTDYVYYVKNFAGIKSSELTLMLGEATATISGDLALVDSRDDVYILNFKFPENSKKVQKASSLELTIKKTGSESIIIASDSIYTLKK